VTLRWVSISFKYQKKLKLLLLVKPTEELIINYRQMGLKVSSQKYFGEVESMNRLVAKGPPRFVKLHHSQKEIADELISQLHSTCKLCECLKSFTKALKPKVPFVDTCLPDDDTLRFKKKNLLANSTYQIAEIGCTAQMYGFIPHNGIAYLGRLLRAMQSMIEDDFKIDNGTNSDVLSCEKSVNLSMEILNKLCVTLPKEALYDTNIVWLIENEGMLNEWSKMFDEPKNE
jgi:hypothetical protein